MALSTLKELKDALFLLRESEKDRQKILDKQIKKRGVKKKEKKIVEEDDEDSLFGPTNDKKNDSDEEPRPDADSQEEEPTASSDDAPSDEEQKSGGENSPDDENKKDDDLAGADELNDTPQTIPDTLTGNSFVDRINKIRAGSSVKDEKVKNKIIDYVSRLTSDEQNDLYIHLDSLSRIILGGRDAAEVITPTMVAKKNNEDNKSDDVSKRKQDQNVSKNAGPIVVVKEGIKKHYVEVPVVLRSGRVVSYGHKAHIQDCDSLISHLTNYKACQARGSADEARIADAISVLRRQLMHASKKLKNLTPQENLQQITDPQSPDIVDKE
jgi:hypothetical protein